MPPHAQRNDRRLRPVCAAPNFRTYSGIAFRKSGHGGNFPEVPDIRGGNIDLAAVGSFGGGGFVRRRWVRSAAVGSFGGGGFVRRRWVRSAAVGSFGGGGFVRRRWVRSAAVGSFGGGGFVRRRWVRSAAVGSFGGGGLFGGGGFVRRRWVRSAAVGSLLAGLSSYDDRHEAARCQDDQWLMESGPASIDAMQRQVWGRRRQLRLALPRL